MLRWKKFWILFGAIFLLTSGFVLGKGSTPAQQQKTVTDSQNSSSITPTYSITPNPTQVLGIASEETFLVTKVIDGDTIRLESGQTIRYIGIDTPETVDPRQPVACFGAEASNKNKELVEGKEVVLEKDVSETDRYGRLLRYVYVDGVFVNDYLVAQGFAYASSYPPDVKFQEQFVSAQKEARENNKGLWASCGSDGQSQPQKVSGGDKDCTDFKTHDEAQTFFISQGGPSSDPHKLDSDKDGIACESLP